MSTGLVEPIRTWLRRDSYRRGARWRARWRCRASGRSQDPVLRQECPHVDKHIGPLCALRLMAGHGIGILDLKRVEIFVGAQTAQTSLVRDIGCVDLRVVHPCLSERLYAFARKRELSSVRVSRNMRHSTSTSRSGRLTVTLAKRKPYFSSVEWTAVTTATSPLAMKSRPLILADQV